MTYDYVDDDDDDNDDDDNGDDDNDDDVDWNPGQTKKSVCDFEPDNNPPKDSVPGLTVTTIMGQVIQKKMFFLPISHYYLQSKRPVIRWRYRKVCTCQCSWQFVVKLEKSSS